MGYGRPASALRTLHPIAFALRHSTFGIRHLINPMRILSGIQPSGPLHIGNYFGMMQPAIALQAEGEALYFIADYHALTTLRNAKTLRANSHRVALDFLACGLDPSRDRDRAGNRWPKNE